MDLKNAFLEFNAVIKKAPKRCPTDQLAFWSLLGARYLILAEAIAETNDLCNRAAESIEAMEKKIAHLESENLQLLKGLNALSSH